MLPSPAIPLDASYDTDTAQSLRTIYTIFELYSQTGTFHAPRGWFRDWNCLFWQHVDLRLLYLRVYSEVEDKRSIWEYLLAPLCRLRTSELVCGTDG